MLWINVFTLPWNEFATKSLAMSLEDKRAIAFTINVDAMMISEMLNIAMLAHISSSPPGDCSIHLNYVPLEEVSGKVSSAFSMYYFRAGGRARAVA